MIDFYQNQLQENGVIHVKDFYSDEEIYSIKEAISDSCLKPSPFHHTTNSNEGSFYMDYDKCKRVNSLEKMCKYEKTTSFIKVLCETDNLWLFHDHILIKSGLAPATPWHHDRPYYIFDGKKNLSVWTPTNDVPSELGMIFLKGSHLTNKLYMPRSFRDGEELGSDNDFDIIDDEVIDSFEKLTFDMKKGDVLVFLNNTIHSANAHSDNFERQSLSVRYLVDTPSMTQKYINATPPFDRLGVKVIEGDPVPEKFFPKL